jgi:hypothetical protein
LIADLMTSSNTDPGQATEEERGRSRRWWILALAAVAQLMVVLDVTVVNIALPSAQAALHSRTLIASGS